MIIVGVGSGWAGTFGHIDPETGVVAVFATQILPSLDGDIFRYLDEFEKTVYSNLQVIRPSL